VKDTFAWLIEPLGHVLNTKQMTLIGRFGNIAPYIELFIGIGLLIKPLRFIALPLVIAMHVFILLMLGPTGRSFNYVVWPWNIVMMVLCFLLYSRVKQERFFDISFLFKHISFYLVVTVMLIFPLFSLNNKYDSYLSSSLYSGNTHGGKLILSDKAYMKLPYYLRSFTAKNSNYNSLYIKHWAMAELNTPCLPEYRIFKTVQERVIILTGTTAEDVKLEFKEREKIFDF